MFRVVLLKTRCFTFQRRCSFKFVYGIKQNLARVANVPVFWGAPLIRTGTLTTQAKIIKREKLNKIMFS